MKYKKLLIKSGIALGCVLVGVWFLLGKGVIIGHNENQEDRNFELGIWTSGTRFEQTFIASQDDLCRIDFAVDSYYPWDVSYLDCFIFEIATSKDPHTLSYDFIAEHRSEVRHTRINGWLISGHMFNRFAFAPIPDSKGKRYMVRIEAPDVRAGDTTILLASPEERYEHGHLFVNGEQQEGDLAFRALYAKSRWHLLRQSARRLALYKPFPFSSPVTYYVLLLVYLVLLGLFLKWVIPLGREG